MTTIRITTRTASTVSSMMLDSLLCLRRGVQATGKKGSSPHAPAPIRSYGALSASHKSRRAIPPSWTFRQEILPMAVSRTYDTDDRVHVQSTATRRFSAMDWISMALLIVGGLNWGL